MKKLTILILIFFSGLVIFAQGPTKEDATKVIEAIKAWVASQNPNSPWAKAEFEFDKVEVSEIPGLLKARFYAPQGDQKVPVVIYFTKDAKYAVLGTVVDLTAKVNLTQQYAGQAKSQPIDMSKINLNDGARIGNLNAPVKIIEYSDFQCPYCKRVAPTVKEIIKNYGNDVVFIFKNFPLGFHTMAKPMAIAAECAREQKAEAFWKFHDTFFSDSFALPSSLDELKTKVADIAKSAGLDVSRFNDCFNNNKTEQKVKAQSDEAASLGITGTPGFIINGQKISGALPYEQFKEVIEQKLKESKGSSPKNPEKKEAPKKKSK